MSRVGQRAVNWTVLGLGFEYLNSEINPHFANIVSPREYVVVTRFHVELDGGGGLGQAPAGGDIEFDGVIHAAFQSGVGYSPAACNAARRAMTWARSPG